MNSSQVFFYDAPQRRHLRQCAEDLMAEDGTPAIAAAESNFDRFNRAHDWAASPVGPVEKWPTVLQTLTRLMLASSQPMFVVWGPERTTIYNDAYGELLATKHPALGQPFHDIWPEIWKSDLEQIVERAYAGESVHMDDIQLQLNRKGYPEETHFSFSYTPVYDAAGAVAGFFCPCLEITEQVLERRRAALRAELTDHLRASTDASETAFVAAALLARHLGAEQAAYGEFDDAGEYAYVARDWNDGRMASNAGRHRLADFGAAFAADLKAGVTVAIDDVRKDPRTSTPDALKTFESRNVLSFLNIPFLREGRLVAFLAVNSREPRHWRAADLALAEEVAERVNVAIERGRAEAALRDSEARLRALVTSTSNVVFSVNADWREMRILGGHGLLMETSDRTAGWIESYIVPAERPMVTAAVRLAIASKSTFDLEHQLRRVDGSLAWVRTRAVPLMDDGGQITEWFGTATDISDRKEAEQHQNMLMAELDHRVKNVLAVVQSIARQSLRGDDGTKSDSAERFVGRLTALAHSHTLLASNRWEGASFRALVEDALAPCQDQHTTRVSIEGPDLQLTPKSAQTVTLALHELVTNSVKYGALSNQAGRVAVVWGVSDETGDGCLHLSWTERDGPLIEHPPAKRGFGSRLIEQALAFELRGDVSLDFQRDGLSATMKLPLENLTASRALSSSTNLPRPKAAAHSVVASSASSIPEGSRVLLVEDEHMVATEMAANLTAAGCRVIGPVPSLSQAIELAESEDLDAAILDINLGGDLVWPAAKRLRARGVPLIFATGYVGTIDPPAELADSVWVEKPVQPDELTTALAALLARPNS
jgi:two-component sensor histidine kinase/PAS domain-containing protein/CheY-like chemotaxis protein